MKGLLGLWVCSAVVLLLVLNIETPVPAKREVHYYRGPAAPDETRLDRASIEVEEKAGGYGVADFKRDVTWFIGTVNGVVGLVALCRKGRERRRK